jgi:hypothetical protein
MSDADEDEVKFARRAFRINGGLALRGVGKTIKKFFGHGVTHRHLRQRVTNIGGDKLRVARRKGQALDIALATHINTDGTHSSLEAKAVVSALLLHDIVPVSAQTIVYNKDWRLATAIDMVGTHTPSGNVVVIEVKRGHVSRHCLYDARRKTIDTKKLKHLPTLNNTPVNHHRLQCVIGGMMLAGTDAAVRHALVYLNTDGKSCEVITDMSDINRDKVALVLLMTAATRVTRRKRKKITKKHTKNKKNKSK